MASPPLSRSGTPPASRGPSGSRLDVSGLADADARRWVAVLDQHLSEQDVRAAVAERAQRARRRRGGRPGSPTGSESHYDDVHGTYNCSYPSCGEVARARTWLKETGGVAKSATCRRRRRLYRRQPPVEERA